MLKFDKLFPSVFISLLASLHREIISQTDLYLVNLSSKTYGFEDKMTKYQFD